MGPEAEQRGERRRVGRLVLFSGRVQGVGFRYTACHIARHFTVTGYVRNLPDGRVELLAEGNPEEFLGKASNQLTHRMKHVFKYAFVDMVREIGPELLLGLALAALVGALTPVGEFVGEYFGGGLGYAFSLVFGMMMYICSTASVPLVHAFISQGMNIGAGMVMLIVGPVTSWGTILVLRKEFGGRVLTVYLVTISITALTLGYLFSII